MYTIAVYWYYQYSPKNVLYNSLIICTLLVLSFIICTLSLSISISVSISISIITHWLLHYSFCLLVSLISYSVIVISIIHLYCFSKVFLNNILY
ncbi:hypothetical protein [Pseudomonas phage vB_Pa-PAC2]